MNADRDNEKYLLTKMGAARRIIHASIRMVWINEDPLAINLIAQSADRLTSDLMGHGKDIIWDSAIIIESKKAELLNIVREASNFVKHADRSPKANLPIYNLQASAEIATFFSILRMRELSGSFTCHMKLYLGYFHIRHPGCISPEGQNLLEMMNDFDIESPALFRRMWGKAALLNPIYAAELAADTADSN